MGILKDVELTILGTQTITIKKITTIQGDYTETSNMFKVLIKNNIDQSLSRFRGRAELDNGAVLSFEAGPLSPQEEVNVPLVVVGTLLPMSEIYLNFDIQEI